METGITKRNNIGELSETDLQQLELANIIPKGTPSPQVQIFATVCKEKGLSPFQKQIYLLPFKKKVSDKWETHYACIVGIDGYRTIAERTGKYAGSDDPKFNDDKTEFKCRDESSNNPITATVTVYKMVEGQRIAYTATAGWNSYVPPENKRFKWIQMPFLMLGKVAEALALRKAFPEALSGLHAEEEKGGFDDVQNVDELNKEEISANILIKYKSKIDEFKKYNELEKEAVNLVSKAVTEGLNIVHSKELTDYGNVLYLKLKKEAIQPKKGKTPSEPQNAQKSSENRSEDGISDKTIKNQLPLMPEIDKS